MKMDLLEYKKWLLYAATASTVAFGTLACAHEDEPSKSDLDYAIVYDRTDDGVRINPIKIGYYDLDGLCKVISEKELQYTNIGIDDEGNGIVIQRNVDGMPVTYVYDINDKKREYPIIIYHSDKDNNIKYDYQSLKKLNK